MNGREGGVPSDYVLHENPGRGEAESAIRFGLSSGRVVIVVGTCRVDYRGRAASSLDYGERILIAKADGSLLVHRGVGYEPVNWQPPGCVFVVREELEGIKISARRPSPPETLEVTFAYIRFISLLRLRDAGEFALYVTEAQMREALLLAPDMLEEGFRPLSAEQRMGTSGFTDIIGLDKEGRLVIVEVKRGPAGREAVLQLVRYVEEVRKDTRKSVRGILVAPAIRKGVQAMLAKVNLEYRQVSPDKCYDALRNARTAKITDY